MADKIPVAIIGSGNIGADLMLKLEDHPRLEMKLMVGIDERSDGLALAKQMGYAVTAEGAEGFKKHHEMVKIVYDRISPILIGFLRLPRAFLGRPKAVASVAAMVYSRYS